MTNQSTAIAPDVISGWVMRTFGTQLTETETWAIVTTIAAASAREAERVPFPALATASDRIHSSLFRECADIIGNPPRVPVRIPACSVPPSVIDPKWLNEVWWRVCEMQPARLTTQDFTNNEYEKLRAMDAGTSSDEAAEILAGIE